MMPVAKASQMHDHGEARREPKKKFIHLGGDGAASKNP
jgi:hypothetical protein